MRFEPRPALTAAPSPSASGDITAAPLCLFEPASVAQLDACPTGDQEVTGSTPAEVSATFFRGD